jgi:hypothetical protein
LYTVLLATIEIKFPMMVPIFQFFALATQMMMMTLISPCMEIALHATEMDPKHLYQSIVCHCAPGRVNIGYNCKGRIYSK